ncbi:hypothetical protein [Arthrobacter zhaoxinii]|uniref:hypothetical protein n=1 Tax=Arthrobacter zhaoxinii TaxID=2964616 RepID=UPI002106A3CF|nr:hypothetical protein [Arthrobacter zhaoxinii]MCQ2001836.1 hypothetical protein [Arthrobacter zhaoxinii]
MPDFLPPKVVGVQQRPLYLRVRSILIILSTLWLISAVIGVGFFSGGTTSLAFSLILLYGTGAALLVVISALYRVLSRAALQRVVAAPDDNAAAVFVDTTRSATEEIMAALRPATPRGRPAASVRMPRTVDAVDVAAALAARTAAMTNAVAAEKSAVAAAGMVAKPTAAGKSAVSRPAGQKKTAPNQPAQANKAQASKAQAGRNRPATNTGSRGTGNQASTAPKKSTGGKKPGAAGNSASGGKGTKSGSGEAAAGAKGPAGAADSAAAKALTIPGIRTAQQDILPRQTGAPSCGLATGPARAGSTGDCRYAAA